MVKDLENI